MALITCPECKARISEHASACPQCGYKLGPFMASMIKRMEKRGVDIGEISNKESVGQHKMTLRSSIFTILGILVVAFVGAAYFVSLEKKPKAQITTSAIKQEESRQNQNSVAVPQAVETKKEYIASAILIGESKNDPIYIKDFIKNPDKYKNKRVKIRAKVTSISEKDNKTIINVIITYKYDPAVIVYDGSLPVYDNDVLDVFGEVYGSLEGQNGMGATMSWPTIIAKYVKKLGTDNSE